MRLQRAIVSLTLAALSVVALAQVFPQSGTTQRAAAVISTPLNPTTGPYLEEDANTVSHVVMTPNLIRGQGSWGAYVSGSPTPVMTVTAGQADPFGGTAAVRVTFSGNTDTAGEYALYRDAGSAAVQTFATTGTYTMSAWVKANDATTSIPMAFWNGVATYQVGACALSGAWARCTFSGTVSAAGQIMLPGFGWYNTGAYPGGQTMPATVDVSIYGVQIESGVTAGPYWPTTTTAGLVDSKANSWTQNGTVPQNVSSGLYPQGFTGGERKGAGPFADANYYSQGTGNDAMDSTGDRWGCITYIPTSFASQGYLLSNASAGTAGYRLAVNATTGQFVFFSSIPGDVSTGPANGSVLNAPNMACWWRTGTSINAKLNLGTTSTNASAGTEVAGTSYSMKLGRYESAGIAFTGTILEVIQGLGSCPGGNCEVWATKMQRRFFSHLTQQGQPVTVTRASTQAVEVNTNQRTPGLLTADANTVSHVVWDGVSIVDRIGVAWTQNGTVPQVAATPLAPPSAGVFAVANSYQGPTTLGEWATNDWSVTVIFRPTSTAAAQTLVAKAPVGGAGGWRIYLNVTTGIASLTTYDGAAKYVDAGTPVLNAVNIATFGRSGGTIYGRLNGAAVVSTGSIGTMTAASAEPIRIGKDAANGSPSTTTTLYEILATTTPYNDSAVAALHAAVLAKVNQPIGLTTVGNGALAVERDGASIWGSSSGYVLQNQTSCVANAVQTPWAVNGAPTCVTDSAVAPDGTTTMDTWDNTASTTIAGPWQTPTLPSSTVFTVSAWMAKASGTGSASLMVGKNTIVASACACGTSDGSACTASVYASNYCKAVFTAIGTTPIRGWVTGTLATAQTVPEVYMTPGDHGVSTGTTRFWRPNVEPLGYPTPTPDATVAAAVPRSATVATIPLPDLARSNFLLRSENTCSGGTVVAPWSRSGVGMTCTANVATTPGGINLDEWTAAGAGDYIVTTAVTPTSSTFTGSVVMAKGAPGSTGSIVINGTGAASGCTCGVEDGSACTAAVYSTNYCKIVATALGTTPVRVWGSGTFATPGTTASLAIGPENFQVAAGTVRIGGAQLEPGLIVKPYLRTVSTAATEGNKWCMAWTITAGAGRPWYTSAGWRALSNYTGTLPNIVSVFHDGSIRWSVYDGAGTEKYVSYSTIGLVAGSTHRWVGCNNLGTLSLYLDGAPVGTEAGAGTGIQTTTVGPLGFTPLAGDSVTGRMDGYLRDFRLYNGVGTYLPGM